MQNPSEYNFIEGETLLIDKPLTWTSFDTVNKIHSLLKKHLGVKKIKVGHAGTLDPLATGLMIICTGKLTKSIESLTGLDKEYIAQIHLGATTPSFDLETKIDKEYSITHLTLALIEQKISELKQVKEQLPPMYSAKWIDGVRAYEHARKGIIFDLKMVPITIHEISIIDIQLPVITLQIKCSKGTYIRSIARDLGELLNCGAHLIGLKRTVIGNFLLNNAITLDEFENILKTNDKI